VSPKVSILLPAFDAAETLAAALRSIQRQTETSWECVVVDDGSRDATLEVAQRWARADARFRIVASPHLGIVSALTIGLTECRAPLVARMDADDLMQRRRLERQQRWLSDEPRLAGVGSHVRLFPRASISDGLRSYERWLTAIRSSADVRRELFVECPIAHPTLMIRREALLGLGYRDCAWPEDYDLVQRMLEHGLELSVVPERLLHWRDGPARLSRSSARYSLSAFVACKAHFLARGFLRDSDTYILWGFGDTGKALAEGLAQHGKKPSAIVELHPGRLGQLIRGVRVVAPDALPSLPRRPLVASVAGIVPRTEIREALASMGFVELRDFVCAA